MHAILSSLFTSHPDAHVSRGPGAEGRGGAGEGRAARTASKLSRSCSLSRRAHSLSHARAHTRAHAHKHLQPQRRSPLVRIRPAAAGILRKKQSSLSLPNSRPRLAFSFSRAHLLWAGHRLHCIEKDFKQVASLTTTPFALLLCQN